MVARGGVEPTDFTVKGWWLDHLSNEPYKMLVFPSCQKCSTSTFFCFAVEIIFIFRIYINKFIALNLVIKTIPIITHISLLPFLFSIYIITYFFRKINKGNILSNSLKITYWYIRPSPCPKTPSFLFSHRENRGCAARSYPTTSLSYVSAKL